jgi:D-alanine-D-alanine ligase-like ATP-grasp enzyme
MQSNKGTIKTILKPVHEGSSLGMAKATNVEELLDALDCAFEFDNEVLIEEWIAGEEYTVPILNAFLKRQKPHYLKLMKLHALH